MALDETETGPPLEVHIVDERPIHPSSPFRTCLVLLEGEWAPQLPARTWQPLWARSPDERLTALVYWDIRDDGPGFVVVTLDVEKKSVIESERQRGCCRALSWRIDGFAWETTASS